MKGFDMKFSEDDKKKFVEFLNFIAVNAKFPGADGKGVDTKFCLEYFKSLNFMQTTILRKIDANIFEVKEVVEAKLPPTPGE